MIVTGEIFRPWLEARIGYVPEGAVFIARVCDGKPAAVVAVGHWYGYDCEIFLGSDAGLSRSLIRAVFRYVFLELNCRRCTARVESGSGWDAALTRLGFKHEGTLRQGQPNGADTAILGLLRPDCRWVNE